MPKRCLTRGRADVIYDTWNSSSNFPEAGHGGDRPRRGAARARARVPESRPRSPSSRGRPGSRESTASRLLTALERRGLVEQDGERGRLRPGPAIRRAAERGLLRAQPRRVAGPSLDALGDDTGETINLAVPGLAGVEHLAQVDSTHFLGAGQWVGRSVDYHCTAVGKVFLAFGRPLPDGPLRVDDRADRHRHAARSRAELDVVRERRSRGRRRRARARPRRDRGAGARARRGRDRVAGDHRPDAANVARDGSTRSSHA